MKKETEEILKQLKSDGLIRNNVDLTADEKTSLIFDYMLKKYSNMLSNNPSEIYDEKTLKKGRLIHALIMAIGRFFLTNPQIMENRATLLEFDNETMLNNREGLDKDVVIPNEPVIFLSNHGFKDDILASMLAVKKRAYLVFGSLPMFFGSVDGLLCAKNGAILVDRKVKESRHSVVDKSKYLLEKGNSILLFPEGVWNKKPNGCMLNFYRGFYTIAKKEDGTFYPIVPIIHYVSNTHKKGKDNPIHTIVDDPIYLDGMSEEEAILYIRERMITWYWKLLEKYGQAKREDLLEGFDNSVEAWDDELIERRKTASKYDVEIETSADLKGKYNDGEIWKPIAEAQITPENVNLVLKAREKVSTFKDNDFQHKF